MLVAALAIVPVYFDGTANQTKAAVKGKLATHITGHWSYWDGSQTVVKTNESLTEKLPTVANKGSSRFTTDNFDANYGAFPTNGWCTSMSWNYSKGDGLGNAVYSIPLAYQAISDGMCVINPFTRVTSDTGTLLMDINDDFAMTDFCIGTGGQIACTKTDAESDWSNKVRLEEQGGTNYIDFTMTHGSPFVFCELGGTKTAKIKARRDLPADITYKDDSMVIVRKFDGNDQVIGFGNYDYYAFFLPDGATTTATQGGSIRNGSFDITCTSHPYFSMAWLCESTGADDTKAKSVADNYKKYAYNFVKDTKATFSYDAATSKVTTNYKYTFDKKSESTANGTIMGVPSHQYKNMTGYDFLDQTVRTIRGDIKLLEGSEYNTVQKYTGILPGLGTIPDADKNKVKAYVASFMDEFGPTDTQVTKEDYEQNTYDCGKKLNRAVQVMLAAEAAGDNENAAKLLKGIKAELADWFTANNDVEEEDKYFYYDKDMGTLFGFPQAYYTVDGMTDHAFHYGYFMNAAAQVALRDPSFVEEYGNVIDELVGDMATTTRNNSDSKYPYLRQFDAWEGHSWASGHGDFGDGNNQESSSEAINGWAGLILYGQATGNQELTNTGIYLYTTEVNAVNDYWFDVDDNVLSPIYKKTYSGMEHRYASMIWDGKYGYETWWTAEPLQTNGINILPNTAASFYLAKDKAYMKDFVRIAKKNEDNYTGQDKDVNRWNEIYTTYIAMYDPDAAAEYFNETCEAEAGDSKAHAWYQVAYMKDKGTPDLSVTGDMPLSAAFTKNGQETYTVYNPTDSDKTVTFSDGTSFTAKAHKLTEYMAEKPTEPTTTPDPTAPTTTVQPTSDPEEGYIKLADGLWYKKIQYEVVGMNDPELLDAGATLQFAFAPTDNVKVYVDGVEKASGESPIDLVSRVIVKMNPKKLPDDSYTNIKIVADSGTTEVIIKKGSPTPPTAEPTTAETTTLAPTTTAETTSVKPTQKPTTETTVAPTESTTVKPTETTTAKPTEKPTVKPTTIKPKPTQTAPPQTKKKPKVGRAVIIKAKKSSKRARKAFIKIRKVKGISGYQMYFYKTKKKAKKHVKPFRRQTILSNKTPVKVYRKSFRGKKKLYVIARLFKLFKGARVYGSWSKVKKMKVKK